MKTTNTNRQQRKRITASTAITNGSSLPAQARNGSKPHERAVDLQDRAVRQRPVLHAHLERDAVEQAAPAAERIP